VDDPECQWSGNDYSAGDAEEFSVATNTSFLNDVIVVPLGAPKAFQVVNTKGVAPVGRAFASMVLAPSLAGNPNGKRIIISGGASAWGRCVLRRRRRCRACARRRA